ncbi:hypothetical protein ElyMa_001302100 [Elysia marginata]|uniref:Uncharacterized protein n=1 Tax=Elysia marginata TaxID=1093978 RepID=A0AAV4IEB4_9GAST|nr:hypothetical protein ElyMa_001302100 [Elysia marginata]
MEREDALQAYAAYKDIYLACERDLPCCLEHSGENIEIMEQMNFKTAIEMDHSHLALFTNQGPSPSKVQNTSFLTNLKVPDVDSQQALRAKSGLCLSTFENFEETANAGLMGKSNGDFSEQEKNSADGGGSSSKFADLSLSRSSQQYVANLVRAEPEKIESQSSVLDESKTCTSEEMKCKKDVPPKKKIKTKSIFPYFFAFDQNFQPLSFVFGEASICDMPTSKPAQKGEDRRERHLKQTESFLSHSVPAQPPKKVIASSYVISEGTGASAHIESKDIGRKCESTINPSGSGMNMCSCAYISKPSLTSSNIRRHSTDNAQFHSGINKQMFAGNDCFYFPSLLPGCAKDTKTTGSSTNNEDDNGDQCGGFSQHIKRSSSFDSGNSLEPCVVHCSPQNYAWNEKIERKSKEGKFSLLGSRLVRAIGLRKEENLEECQLKPKKTRSSDFILKEPSVPKNDCPKCKVKRSWCKTGKIKDDAPLKYDNVSSCGDAKSSLVMCHKKEFLNCCVEGRHDLSEIEDCCDKVVCLDLPLTNFGFYSGEMMILM